MTAFLVVTAWVALSVLVAGAWVAYRTLVARHSLEEFDSRRPARLPGMAAKPLVPGPRAPRR